MSSIMKINIYQNLREYDPVLMIGLVGTMIYLACFLFSYAYTTPVGIPYLEFLFLPLTLLILGLVSRYDKKIYKKAVIYFVIGLLWEVLTEANWTYATGLMPMIYFYNDVPIAMLFYWVSVFSLAFFFFSQLTKKFKVSRLLAQMIILFMVFLVAESVGFHILGIWNYNFAHISLIPPYFLPPHIFVGYLTFGNLFLVCMHEKLYKYRNCAGVLSKSVNVIKKNFDKIIGWTGD
ncbi:MAG: hypothetical protein KAU03_07035 [Candidatus Altiarchaeales archaeon]|nr:hypothetical protein [Candidatus Altiarchaeales archaeon]